MTEVSLVYKLAFNFIPNIGAVNTKNLISYCGGTKEVFEAKKSFLLKIPGIGEKKVNDILKSDALRKAEKELKKIEEKKISVCFYLDENYPSRLKNFSDSPIILYTKGQEINTAERIVGIVGTRTPTQYGISECEKLIEALQKYKVTVISGLAYGIDTTAHRKSVELNCPTFGVLGQGLDSIYPSSNKLLAKKMMAKGGIISEFELGTKPDRENFPRRNRIIAGLSDALIVMESKIKGGSMITAEIANSYNKDVFAVPGKVTDPMSLGCNHLIKTHKAHLLHSADDIAYIMGWDKKEQFEQMTLPLDLSPEEKKIHDIINTGEQINIDTLAYKSLMKLSELNAVLLNLEFKGLIKSLPGKNYILF